MGGFPTERLNALVKEAEKQPMITQAQEGKKAVVLKLRIENRAGILLEKGEGIYIIFLYLKSITRAFLFLGIIG